MAKEPLDSDRLNYLVWRYLAESGYVDAAVHLQKQWNVEDPQQLPFAPHVTSNHALVTIVNKGLLYNACERDAKLARGIEVPATGFFGPLSALPEPRPRPRPALDEDDLENVRKRQLELEQLQVQVANPPAKRPRLSNGYVPNGGLDSTPRSPMDVDEDQIQLQQAERNNAYPSPEQLPSPVAATLGPEQGTQIDKVSELAADTTFLDLTDDGTGAGTIAAGGVAGAGSGAAAAPAPRHNNNAILLQCEWNPRDPTILAAAGTDALARMWTFSRTSTTGTSPTAADTDPEAQPQPQPQGQNDAPAQGPAQAPAQDQAQRQPRVSPHHNLLDEGSPQTTTATGLAWTSDGLHVAIASEALEDGTARIDIWNTDGMSVATFMAFESPIICLRWNPANTLLLAISPESEGTVVTVMSPATQETVQTNMPRHSLAEQPLEAAWTSNEEFVVCGGDLLHAYHCSAAGISSVRKYETREGHALSKVVFDWPSRLLATASDTGMIDIWDHQGQCNSFNAHQGLITSLLWQPVQNPVALSDDAERLLVSAGEDGAISIWNARSSEAKSTSSMTMGSSVVALAFTPDGAFVAGATSQRILIWKFDDVSVPRASWLRGSEMGWQTPQSNDSANEEDQHCLSWDANGQKLAYGVNSLLAVITFRR